jgi:hypothetical protein
VSCFLGSTIDQWRYRPARTCAACHGARAALPGRCSGSAPLLPAPFVVRRRSSFPARFPSPAALTSLAVERAVARPRPSPQAAAMWPASAYGWQHNSGGQSGHRHARDPALATGGHEVVVSWSRQKLLYSVTISRTTSFLCIIFPCLLFRSPLCHWLLPRTSLHYTCPNRTGPIRSPWPGTP